MQALSGSTLCRVLFLNPFFVRVVLFVFSFQLLSFFFLPVSWFHFISVAPLQLHEVLR